MQPSRISAGLHRPTIRRVTKNELKHPLSLNQLNDFSLPSLNTNHQILIADQIPLRQLSNNIRQSRNHPSSQNAGKISSRRNRQILPNPPTFDGVLTSSTTKFSFTANQESGNLDSLASERKKRNRLKESHGFCVVKLTSFYFIFVLFLRYQYFVGLKNFGLSIKILPILSMRIKIQQQLQPQQPQLLQLRQPQLVRPALQQQPLRQQQQQLLLPALQQQQLRQQQQLPRQQLLLLRLVRQQQQQQLQQQLPRLRAQKRRASAIMPYLQ
ncbi:unnamed protein product [Rotaria socialis]|uniref:Uncharacterized protein n=1 Tax=Rotaria socialis TaxID=392032 RepID=A0A820AHX7_9BILA|nr:unnamed protein product [Rotaria socialis]CAF4193498.1 unnamed protein product [Rotaria socialis]